MAQQVKNPAYCPRGGRFDPWPRPSGLRTWCSSGVPQVSRCDVAQMGSGIAGAVAEVSAVALIQSLAWELPHAAGVALKRKKKKKKKGKKAIMGSSHPGQAG